MLGGVISICFYLLFLATPLIFTSFNHELFEYNKMMFVYLLTIIITACWVLRSLNEEKLILKRTILDIPILLFLLANIASTITSMDAHTSIWGYYTRSNGGLLSVVAYSTLYFAFCANIESGHVLRFIKAAVWGGFLVALYAIPEHFGVSPSCVALYQQLSADCWIQDVQARVFATLGQPNWLAAYLAMTVFPTLYLVIRSKNILARFVYTIVALCLYMAFTFTYSRGGSLGTVSGLLVFPAAAAILYWWKLKKIGLEIGLNWLKTLLPALAGFLAITLLFGSALWNFRLITPGNVPIRPGLVGQAASGTQLETGGTESGQIRLIVWRGALEIFKQNPLFGSGVETFAYAYYMHRPKEHNLVSEWDFLYNKAHNEYLNYLANMGVVGLGTYLAFVGVALYWIGKKAFSLKEESLFFFSIGASIISYLVQNLFGFSVVSITLLLYLFAGSAVVLGGGAAKLRTDKGFLKAVAFVFAKLFHSRRRLTKILRVSLGVLVAVLALNYIFLIGRYWFADTLFAKGSNLNDRGSVVSAYRLLSQASALNPNEPLYRLEKAYSGAGIAAGLKEDDATLSSELKKESDGEVSKVLADNPKNITYLRSAIRTYFELSSIDEAYNQKTLESFDKAIVLASTDPKLYYNKGLVLGGLNRSEEALSEIQRAIDLKLNYREAYISKAAILLQLSKADVAKQTLLEALEIFPGDGEISQKLEALENQ